MYRFQAGVPEVFLVHPGGPFWAKKDAGAWSIPKGEYSEDEDPLGAALREFREETGVAPEGELIELGEVRQPGGKLVRAWAVEGNFDAARLRSNMFSLEWPPRTGKLLQFPEVDRGEWFSIETARLKLLKGQLGLVERLVLRLREGLEFC